LHRREDTVVAGLGAGRDRELAPEVTSVGVSDRTPILVPPVLRELIVPGYPSNAFHLVVDRGPLAPTLRVEAAQGRVVLRILVRLDGSVARAEVAESAGIPVLDDAAVQAARRWLFVPATRDGQPIEAWAFVAVRFMMR
jgi:protein TonB